MFGIIAQRGFHVGKATMNVTKISFLAKLRKSTGYSVANCKKALELFPGDIQKAEEWLHAEAKNKGWAKWAKVQSRSATQGLIGVCSRDNVGVMVEVNCETDFVARNKEFQEFIGRMLSSCVNYATNLSMQNDVTKVTLEESELNAIKCETSTLGELIVAATSKFNEKTVAKRAVFLKVKEDVLLNSLSHPAVLCPNLNGASLGKYGSLVATRINKTDDAEDSASEEIDICQHIIGMNPLSIGELTDKDIAKFSAKDSSSDESEQRENAEAEQNLHAENMENSEKSSVEGQKAEDNVLKSAEVEQSLHAENVESSEESSVEGQKAEHNMLKDSDETRLLFQPYLLDSNITVGEMLFKSGVEVLTFERFECGEIVEEQPKVAQSVGA